MPADLWQMQSEESQERVSAAEGAHPASCQEYNPGGSGSQSSFLVDEAHCIYNADKIHSAKPSNEIPPPPIYLRRSFNITRDIMNFIQGVNNQANEMCHCYAMKEEFIASPFPNGTL